MKHVTTLVRIDGWGVRCSCGYAVLSRPGNRLLKSDAVRIAAKHEDASEITESENRVLDGNR